MDLKLGYKQTEVGVIPEDWELQTLYDITSEIGDGIHSTPNYSDSGNYYFINGNNIQNGKIRISRETKKVNYSEFKKYQKNLGNRTILLSINGTIGNLGLYNSELIILGKSAAYLTVKSDFEKLFVYFFLQTETVLRQFEDGLTGTTIKNLGLSIIRNTWITLPPLLEQQAIAEALSDADAFIESLEQLITKKRQVKQGTMQELLTGKTRLEGFSGEWLEKTFGEVFEYCSTATNSRSDLSDNEDTYYLHYGDIHTRFHSHLDFRISQPPRINRNKCRNATLVKNGDWVMADASEDFDGVGKSIEIIGLEEGTAVVAGLHTCLLREKKPTFALGFKGHLGNLKSLHTQFLRVMTGMKVYGVSKTALKDLLLLIPPLLEQQAIATVLSDMDAEITALETKLEKARQVKQGMMHNLLTGRIRLV